MVLEICCFLLEEMIFLINCMNKNLEVYRLIMSFRVFYVSDLKLCLVNIWKCMDERFGFLELFELLLKFRL